MSEVYNVKVVYRGKKNETTSDQNRPGSNCNEGVYHFIQISRTGTSLSDIV